MKRNKDIIEVDGKCFQKSRIFGNWKVKTVFRNKKAYSRKGRNSSEQYE